MTRLRVVLVAAGMATAYATAIPVSCLNAQQAPAPRVLATFTGDSISEFKVSPDGRFVLLATSSKLRMYQVSTKQTWDVADGRVGVLAWSPAGDRIAWTQFGARIVAIHLWAMPVDARTGRSRGAAQRLTAGPSALPVFSPDGKRIAYITIDTVTRRMRLAVVASTGGPERVVADSLGTEDIVWSASGKSLFIDGGTTPSDRPGIVKIDIDSRRRTMIPTPRGESLSGALAGGRYLVTSWISINATVWEGEKATIIDTTGRVVGHIPLPPGKVRGWHVGDGGLAWIAETDRSFLELKSLAGGAPRRLPLVGESNSVPLHSPDGNRIAFLTKKGERKSLAIMNADGSAPRAFQDAEVFDGEAGMRWSPDSRYVAFRNKEQTRISVLDVNAGSIRPLVDDSIGGWAWRSDSKAIRIRSRITRTAGIDEISMSGERRQLLAWPMPGKATNWAYLGDSSLFIVAASDTAAYVTTFASGAPRQIATVPAGWDARRLAVSNDGRLVAALVFRRAARAFSFNQIATFSVETGAVRQIDLPFNWTTGGGPNPFTFERGDSTVLVFGQRSGETGVKLYRVSLSGGESTVIADVGVALPGGETVGVSTSPDGRSVVYSVHPEAPTRSVVLYDIRSAIPRASRSSRP